MKHIDTAQGRFAYLEAGKAGDPLVLCLHGFPDHPHSFEPMMEHLTGAGYRVVAPWMRGYTPSVSEGPYHIDQLGADAIALAEAFSGDPIAIVGHDWGALATYAATAAAPDRFRCAVTMAVPHPLSFLANVRDNPGQLRRSWYMIFFQLPVVPERVVPRNNFALIDKLWRDWSPGYRLPGAERERLMRCLGRSMPAPINYYRALFRPLGEAMERMRRPASESRIRVPLLNLQGTDDGCISATIGDGQERFFDGPFEYELVGGVGHFMQLEDPVRVSSRVRRWLDDYR
jgi:pimeloyl-ACP methyl ester carboxylesterase